MLNIDKNLNRQAPSIMESLQYMSLKEDDINNFNSIPLARKVESFLFIDSEEKLSHPTAESFVNTIGCNPTDRIKVVAIFGNTGDGKSHTMNNLFFGGREVFETSSGQTSCTSGVYAAFEKNMGVLCLDTEGLLGATLNQSQHKRMLLKVLAISDIIIYRTRAERLHSDLFQFLHIASKAFSTYFSKALESLPIPGTTTTLGPAVVIFHETRHTEPLKYFNRKSPEDRLRERFEQYDLNYSGFSSIRYVGTQTNITTDYSSIISAIQEEIKSTNVRSSRQPCHVFEALQTLNRKFSGQIVEKPINFPDQYFTCTVHCEICNKRCQEPMSHIAEGQKHATKDLCVYQHQYDNKVYYCKRCHKDGRQTLVSISAQSQNDGFIGGLVKYTLSGSVIDCPVCGEIYRSRQYWFGNKMPEEEAVIAQIVHIWKDSNTLAKGYIGQKMVDGVSLIADAVTSKSALLTQGLIDCVTDKTRPDYWRPNHEITHCLTCNKNFEMTGLAKHHCRGCGEGFCDVCSTKRMPVPSRGWTEAVRVCNNCANELSVNVDATPDNNTQPLTHTNSNHNNITGSSSSASGNQVQDQPNVMMRKCTEVVFNGFSSVSNVIGYTKEIVKDTVRPEYWDPDEKIPNCKICGILFGTAEELVIARQECRLYKKIDPKVAAALHGKVIKQDLNRSIKGGCRRHHCRRCGQIVCEECSKTRRPVPERGWSSPERICDLCACKDNSKEAGGGGDAKSKND